MNKKIIAGLFVFSLLFTVGTTSTVSVYADDSNSTTSTTKSNDPVVRTGYAVPTSTSVSILVNAFRYCNNFENVGIIYSPDSEMESDVMSKEVNSYFSTFSAVLKDLKPSTTYYYYAYVNTPDGQIKGEKRSFKTLKPTNVTTGDAVSVTATSATIQSNAYKNIILPIKCGIGYSTKSTDNADNKISVYKPSNFSLKLNDLQPNTTYYYYTYVYNIYGSLFKGEIKSFTTLPN